MSRPEGSLAVGSAVCLSHSSNPNLCLGLESWICLFLPWLSIFLFPCLSLSFLIEIGWVCVSWSRELLAIAAIAKQSFATASMVPWDDSRSVVAELVCAHRNGPGLVSSGLHRGGTSSLPPSLAANKAGIAMIPSPSSPCPPLCPQSGRQRAGCRRDRNDGSEEDPIGGVFPEVAAW